MAVLLGVLGVVLVFDAAGSAEATADLAYNQPCAGPASTPACASRTWYDCFRHRNPAQCALVGFQGMRFSEDESGGPESKEDFSYPKITGVRRVSPERFRVSGAPNYRVPARLIGTHEVPIKLEICDPKIKCAAQMSEFYKKVEKRWVIVSWVDNVLGCEGTHDSPDPPPECRIYIPFLPPWND